MPEPVSYEYAVVRIVPRVDRQEFINAGVIVFARQGRLLVAKTHVDEARLRALWPGLDVDEVRRHLIALDRICKGDPEAGPMGRMSQSERFHWLTAPRSTVIQMSPVHTGISADPASVVDELAREMVGIS